MIDEGRETRWRAYALFIVLASGIMLARVARVRSPDPKSPTPFLSANDRSRWATIRALADEGTYAIDSIIFDKDGKPLLGWHTIDLVRHRGPDGREHYYSSKPTLLTTLLAGEYCLIKTITGATLAHDTAYVARLMLILTNVVPLAAALALLARMMEDVGGGGLARVFAMAAACFATFLTTFAVTLNNHLVAAISLVVGLAAAVPIWRGEGRAWWRFALAGVALSFMAANELPALALLGLAGLGLAWKDLSRTLLGFIPGAAVVAAGAFGTNFIAHGDLKPPYAHRQDGPVVATIADGLAVPLNEGKSPPELIATLREKAIEISEQSIVEPRIGGGRWVLWDEPTQTRLALVRAPEGRGKVEIQVRQWDNWYDYEGSYWLPDKLRGTDRGEPSRAVYALNVLIGHHGLFSLTPIWLLSAVGALMWLWRGDSVQRALGFTTVVTTIVILAFYIGRPLMDRNYGGVTCCLRWMIWLTPLWLVTLLPAVDWLGRWRWGRVALLVALGISVFSALYAADNPWSHAWIFDYWTAMGWIRY
jgi:hypothetical protein